MKDKVTEWPIVNRVQEYISLEGNALKVVPRDEIKKKIREMRAEQRASADRDNNPGCLFLGLNLVERIFDPSGSKAEKKEEDSLTSQAEGVTKLVEEAKILIEEGIKGLNEKAKPFIDSLPEDSLGRRALERYGHACICETTTLPDGSTYALLRGAIKGDQITTEDLNPETVPPTYSNSCAFKREGCLVDGNGNLHFLSLKVYRVSNETNHPYTKFRSYLGSDMLEGDQNVAFGMQAGIAESVKKGQSNIKFAVRDHQSNIELNMFDSDNQAEGKKLKRLFEASQRRAIMVAYDISKKGVSKAKQSGADALLG